VLAIPSNAIVGRGVSRFVYRLAPQGATYRVHRQPVEIGLANWDRTEITSGLGENTLIVTSLNEKGLEDGALVSVDRTGSDSSAVGAGPAAGGSK
jgi:hypothetical protein